MLELNCVALTELSLELVPAMIARGSGAIINLASIAAFLPMPGMTIYAASKAYVRSFSLALRHELRDTGVRVLCHCPGPVPTEFREVSGLERSFNFPPGMTPKQVVTEALRALEADRAQVINGWVNRILVGIASLMPAPLILRIIQYVLGGEKGSKK